MKSLMEFLARRSNTEIFLISTGMLLLIGIFDFLTGPELGFSIFYLLPIMVVAWFVSRRAAFYASVIGALVWLPADFFSREWFIPLWVYYWNAVLLLGVFLTLTHFISVLREANEREKERARTDYVTGIANSRCFYEQAEMELQKARRYRHPLTIAYMDIDNFKEVNDQKGHATGDRVLKGVSETIRRHIRSVDLLARIGGDEFVMLFPETGPEEAPIVVKRVRSELMKVAQAQGWPITFSVGVLSCREVPESLQKMVSAADRLMYQAKSSGKNTVCYEIFPAPKPAAPPLPPEPSLSLDSSLSGGS